MTRVTMLETIHRWDVFTFQRIISSHLDCNIVTTARALSSTADGWTYPLIPAALYISGIESAGLFLQVAATALLVERVLYLLLKRGFKRKRPANIVPGYKSHIIASDEFSFPSGHTSAAFLMVSLIVMFYGPAFAPLYLWAVGVGASRVILGVHFPTDIFVGSLMGSSIALATTDWYSIL